MGAALAGVLALLTGAAVAGELTADLGVTVAGAAVAGELTADLGVTDAGAAVVVASATGVVESCASSSGEGMPSSGSWNCSSGPV